MAKIGTAFLLEKGDKLLFGVGAAGMVGLIGFGAMELTAASDPKTYIKGFESDASRITSAMNNDAAEVAPLPPWVVGPSSFKAISPQGFGLVGPPFEPIHQPDMLRENPRVLGVYAAQLDVIRAPMRSLDLDVQTDANGNPQVQLGVLFNAQVADKDKAAVKKSVGAIAGQVDRAIKNKSRFARPMGPQPPQPPAPGPEGSGAPPVGAGQRDDRTVRYFSPEQIEAQGLPLAETVYPMRAVVVYGLFPLKAQLEEIKRALRLQTIQQAVSEAQGSTPGFPGPGPGGPAGIPGPMGTPGTGMPATGTPSGGLYASVGPVFDGFEVQRRVITPSGQDLGWAPYDHYNEYFTKVRSRKIADEPDNPYLLPFLRYDQKLAAPLPQLADKLANYPPIRIPQVVDAINKIKEAGTPVPTQSDWNKRFGNTAGDANPYAPFGSGALSGAVSGTAPGMPPGPGMPAPVGLPMPGGPGVREGMPGPGGAAPVGPAMPEVEDTLIRFLDPDVKPGYTYQYQIRMRMKNPNYKRTRDVREPTAAQVEYLEGPWVTLPDAVTLPAEEFVYAYDSAEYMKKAETLLDDTGKHFRMRQVLEYNEVQKGTRAVVQVQRWMEQVRATGDKIEPIGAWVVAEFPVAPGEYIGKRTLVKLPLWSAGAQNYVLRELASAVKVFGIPDAKQPKGWPVSFRTRPPLLLVDFEGGEVVQKVGAKDVKDECASELLILQPNGKLTLKNSLADMADKNRSARETTWDEWLARVKQRKDAPVTPAGGPGGDVNPFAKPGGA